MDWFRSYHGAATDPKWLVIARKAQCTPGAVASIWWALMDYASSNTPRGSVQDFDAEVLDVFYGYEDGTVARVLGVMRVRGMIEADGKLEHSDRDQPRYGWERGGAWEMLRRAVFERDDYTCRYCGATDQPLHCDHVFPRSRGGSNALENLTTACSRCNQSKGARLLHEWRPEVALA